MSEFVIDKCPVCDNNQFSPFLTTTDFFVSGEEFEIRQCTGCGLKFTFNSKDEEQIGRYYQSEDYISHSNTGKGFINALYHLVRKYMLRRKRNLVEKITRKQKGDLLDVGAGTGFFLREMKQRGWQVTGTEKSPDARKFAKKKFKLQLKPSSELFAFKEKSFDAITLWHVLEHIHRLNDYMDAFHRLLKNGGKLIIALPNRASYDARHYREYWAAWDVPRHLWHFAPMQMRLLGDKHGFSLESNHNMPFDSFYVSILSEKYKNSNFPFFKGLLFGKISWLISLTGKDRGSSVIYVFEKKG